MDRDHVAKMEQLKSACNIFTGMARGRGSIGRPRWEDNIRMDLKEIGVNVVANWIVQPRIGFTGESCECRIELLDSISLRVNYLGSQL